MMSPAHHSRFYLVMLAPGKHMMINCCISYRIALEQLQTLDLHAVVYLSEWISAQ